MFDTKTYQAIPEKKSKVLVMRTARVSRTVQGILSICTFVVMLSLCFQPAMAATTYTVVTVRVTGLDSSVTTRIYANGTPKGSVNGEGMLTLIFANLTSSVTISVDNYTPDGYPYYGYNNYLYPGSYGGQYGNKGVAFHCRGSSQTVSAGVNTTLTFRYDPLFFLYVKSDRGNPDGTGWYFAGTLARVAVLTPIEENAGTRYKFDKWIGAQMRENTNAALALVYMDSPKMIEATWITQYKLAVSSPYGQVTGSNWYDKDQTALFSVNSPIEGSEGIRYIFSSWTGDYSGTSPSGNLVMNGPKTVVAGWRTQYLLNVDPKGGQIDKSTQWVESGTSVTISSISPCSVVEKKSRLMFQGWQGATSSSSGTITLVMDGPKYLIANWRAQYYLIVETSRGTAAGEGWYDADSNAEFSVPADVPMEMPLGALGARYVFVDWKGDSRANTPRASILMDKAHIVTASWNTDYGTAVILVLVPVAVVVALALFVRKGTFGRLQRRRDEISEKTLEKTDSPQEHD